MKKSLVLAAMLILSGMSLAHAGHFTDVLPPASAAGCVPVSNGYDYNCTTDTGAPVIQSSAPVSIIGKTIAQLNALAPITLGQVVVCSNCSNTQLCVSTGTSAGAWVIATATGAFTAATFPHCQ